MLRRLKCLQGIDGLDRIDFVSRELPPPIDGLAELIFHGGTESLIVPGGRLTPDPGMQSEQAVDE